MGTAHYSIWIDASPDRVWDVFTNLERIPDWQTGDPCVIEVSGPGDEVGTTYTVRRGPGTGRTIVTEAVRPTIYASRTDAYLGLSFDLTATLRPDRSGTTLTLRADTHWPRGLRLLGRIVEFAFLNQREANRELERLKVLLEAEAAK
jgi:uncharacterized protein YndB with AHSA1/START domain